MMSELFEVIIVRHGTRITQRSDVYLNHRFYDEPDGEQTVDYYLWVVRNEYRTFIVDTGFSKEQAIARERTILVEPADAYRHLGIDTTEPHTVILTHAHYDHIGNVGLFPNSPVVMSAAEYEFWATDMARKRLIAHFTEAKELENLGVLETEGRLETFAGSRELAPGIDVVEVGGHTPGQCMVRVATSDGVVLLASDAVHFREELDKDMPFISVTDLPASYAALQTVRDLVAGGYVDIVIPGHDPSVLDGLEPLAGQLAGNAAIVGRIGN
jgi:glyoxylase-like metal-dependent hydrolase (beta-lactamase superfamily II)